MIRPEDDFSVRIKLAQVGSELMDKEPSSLFTD